MDELTPLERAVLEKLFAGEQPVMVALREQVKRARVRKREWHGTAGFATDLAVPDQLRLDANPDYDVSDVQGNIEGMDRPVLFHSHVRYGAVASLEGDFMDEEWPDPVGRFELTFLDDPRRLGVPGFNPPPPPIESPWSRNPFPASRITWAMSIEEDGVVVTRRVIPIGLWMADKLLALPILLMDGTARFLPRRSRMATFASGLSSHWSNWVASRTYLTEYLVALRSGDPVQP